MTVKWMDGSSYAEQNNSGRLIARYVQSGNQEIHPTSLDLTTGIFTCGESLSSLGMTSGNFYGTAFNIHSLASKVLMEEINPVNDYEMYVLSDNTFQLASGNTTSVILSSYPSTTWTIDCSEFHLERNLTSPFIDLSGFNLSEIRVKISAQRDRGGWAYFSLKGTCDENANWSSWIGGMTDGRETIQLFMELWWKYIPEMNILYGNGLHEQHQLWGNSSSGSWNNYQGTSDSYTMWKPLTNFKMTGLQSNFPMCNGSVIEVFDMKGAY